jgi:polyhydroxybutyrate depolymerase
MTWERLRSRRLLEHTLVCDGVTRTALLYVPQHMRRRGALPLVLVFHGGNSSPQKIALISAMHSVAEREGFVVAYPAGQKAETGLTWDGPEEAERNSADIRFVRQLIIDLLQRYRINPSRIYAAGFSIGGSFVYKLASLLPDRITAAAVVSGTMMSPDLEPARPVPLLHIHGTRDRRVPLEGGLGLRTRRKAEWPAVKRGIDRWLQANGCTGEPHIVRQAIDGLTGYRYSGKADVELWLVEGGRHAWPGSVPDGPPTEGMPRVPGSFSATEKIWSFFARHNGSRRVG